MPSVDDYLATITPDEQTRLALIGQYESGFRNVPNYEYRPGITNQGLYQISDTNWHSIAPQYGIRARSAMAGDDREQTAVALHLLRQPNGFQRNWLNTNPRLRQAMAAGMGPSAQSTSAISNTLGSINSGGSGEARGEFEDEYGGRVDTGLASARLDPRAVRRTADTSGSPEDQQHYQELFGDPAQARDSSAPSAAAPSAPPAASEPMTDEHQKRYRELFGGPPAAPAAAPPAAAPSAPSPAAPSSADRIAPPPGAVAAAPPKPAQGPGTAVWLGEEFAGTPLAMHLGGLAGAGLVTGAAALAGQPELIELIPEAKTLGSIAGATAYDYLKDYLNSAYYKTPSPKVTLRNVGTDLVLNAFAYDFGEALVRGGAGFAAMRKAAEEEAPKASAALRDFQTAEGQAQRTSSAEMERLRQARLQTAEKAGIAAAKQAENAADNEAAKRWKNYTDRQEDERKAAQQERQRAAPETVARTVEEATGRTREQTAAAHAPDYVTREEANVPGPQTIARQQGLWANLRNPWSKMARSYGTRFNNFWDRVGAGKMVDPAMEWRSSDGHADSVRDRVNAQIEYGTRAGENFYSGAVTKYLRAVRRMVSPPELEIGEMDPETQTAVTTGGVTVSTAKDPLVVMGMSPQEAARVPFHTRLQILQQLEREGRTPEQINQEIASGVPRSRPADRADVVFNRMRQAEAGRLAASPKYRDRVVPTRQGGYEPRSANDLNALRELNQEAVRNAQSQLGARTPAGATGQAAAIERLEAGIQRKLTPQEAAELRQQSWFPQEAEAAPEPAGKPPRGRRKKPTEAPAETAPPPVAPAAPGLPGIGTSGVPLVPVEDIRQLRSEGLSIADAARDGRDRAAVQQIIDGWDELLGHAGILNPDDARQFSGLRQEYRNFKTIFPNTWMHGFSNQEEPLKLASLIFNDRNQFYHLANNMTPMERGYFRNLYADKLNQVIEDGGLQGLRTFLKPDHDEVLKRFFPAPLDNYKGILKFVTDLTKVQETLVPPSRQTGLPWRSTTDIDPLTGTQFGARAMAAETSPRTTVSPVPAPSGPSAPPPVGTALDRWGGARPQVREPYSAEVRNELEANIRSDLQKTQERGYKDIADEGVKQAKTLGTVGQRIIDRMNAVREQTVMEPDPVSGQMRPRTVSESEGRAKIAMEALAGTPKPRPEEAARFDPNFLQGIQQRQALESQLGIQRLMELYEESKRKSAGFGQYMRFRMRWGLATVISALALQHGVPAMGLTLAGMVGMEGLMVGFRRNILKYIADNPEAARSVAEMVRNPSALKNFKGLSWILTERGMQGFIAQLAKGGAGVLTGWDITQPQQTPSVSPSPAAASSPAAPGPMSRMTNFLAPDAEAAELPPSRQSQSAMKALETSRSRAIAPIASAADAAHDVTQRVSKGQTPDVTNELRRGNLSSDEIKRILQHTSDADVTSLVDNVPLLDVMSAAEVATPQEKDMLIPLIRRRLQAELQQIPNKTLQMKLTQRFQRLTTRQAA